MFTVTKEDIALILKDFGIFSDIITFSELQRYHYEKNNPASQEVRLIIKANLNNGQSVVVRFKNEWDTTLKSSMIRADLPSFYRITVLKRPHSSWQIMNTPDGIP